MITAVDTNVILRALTRDDPAQAAIATEILRLEFTLSATVLLETEWVLHASYGWSKASIAKAFRNLLDMSQLVDAPAGMDWVLTRYENGADFADMMHLCEAKGASRFVTFDKKIKKYAGDDPPLRVETLTA
ncbi:type II toxin-antitoxin system VapC family toxin [Sphingobium algorifonticola]|uniref:PIN domain-containing protein n=1 Tax=Sphingobium algorifonticola TaxID=2008318 RepID=A0A437J8K2_9SPHN|nr:type II toxin-antitoxin system VapC family toxin [Sphingobium algorifonticola]RVT41829.1 PIN domain-containing protein [Sphingobium algorifonticola]